jgi:O-antigen/teichoic acid export membrane protein
MTENVFEKRGAGRPGQPGPAGSLASAAHMRASQTHSDVERRPVRAAWLTVAMAGSAVANYAYTLLLTYALTPADYAVFAAGHGVLLVLGTFGAVAVPWVLARELVLQAAHPDRQSAALNLALWINVGGGAVLAAGVGAVTLTFGSPPTALVMAATTFLLAVGSTALGYPQRITLLGVVMLGEFAVKLTAGAVLVFVLDLGATAALLAATVGALVPLSACLTCRQAFGRPRRVRLSPGLWRAAGRIGAIQVVVALFTALDTVLVAALATTRAGAGPYQAAATLGRAPLFVSVAVSTAVFPALLARRGDQRQRAQALWTVAVVSTVAVIAMTSAPASAVELIFPSDFAPLAAWLPVVTLSGAGIGMMNLLTTFLQTEDRIRAAQTLMAAGFVLHAALLVAGAQLAGITGLAWGAVIGVWTTVALLTALPSERVAVGMLARRIAMPRPVLLIGALTAVLVLVDQPVAWLASAIAAALAACVVAFPELAARVRPAR